HCQEPRAEVRDQPFYPYPQVRPWFHASGRPPRRAAINAFGFGGINAHVVLEEVPQAATSPLRPRPVRPRVRRPRELLVFPPPTPKALGARQGRVPSLWPRAPADLYLGAVVFTLAGEVDSSLAWKLALVSPAKEQLLSGLSGCRERLVAGSLKSE